MVCFPSEHLWETKLYPQRWCLCPVPTLCSGEKCCRNPGKGYASEVNASVSPSRRDFVDACWQWRWFPIPRCPCPAEGLCDPFNAQQTFLWWQHLPASAAEIHTRKFVKASPSSAGSFGALQPSCVVPGLALVEEQLSSGFSRNVLKPRSCPAASLAAHAWCQRLLCASPVLPGWHCAGERLQQMAQKRTSAKRRGTACDEP